MERKPELARIRTDVGQTPLMWLCLRGEVENTLPFFKALYDAYPQAIHEKDTHGLTPLHLAVQVSQALTPHALPTFSLFNSLQLS